MVDVYKERLTVSGYRPSGAELTSAAKDDIIKENSVKNITAITDKAIDRVPQISIDGFTDEQNAFIQKQHQKLLQYSKVNNGNVEVTTKTKNFNKEKILLDFSRQYRKCVKTGTDAEIVNAIDMFLNKN